MSNLSGYKLGGEGCDTLPDGEYQDALFCNRLVTCHEGVRTVQLCPEGLLFNPGSRQCEPARRVACPRKYITSGRAADQNSTCACLGIGIPDSNMPASAEQSQQESNGTKDSEVKLRLSWPVMRVSLVFRLMLHFVFQAVSPVNGPLMESTSTPHHAGSTWCATTTRPSRSRVPNFYGSTSKPRSARVRRKFAVNVRGIRQLSRAIQPR